MYTIRRPSTPAEFLRATLVLREYACWMRQSAGFDPFAVQPEFARELDDLATYYDAPGRALFVAQAGCEVVGTVAIHLHEDGSAELKRMFVRPAARGAAISGELIAAGLAWSAEQGCREAWLESVRGPMDAAIAVYRRHGFEETTGEHRTLEMTNVVVMQRKLDRPNRPSERVLQAKVTTVHR